jgi:RNA polymerase sigma-70 factor (ECF subfamily)
MDEVSTDILQRCRSGDAEAFADVVQTYERPLFSFVYRFTAAEHGLPDAEDLVQEIFLRVWRGFPGWNPKRNASFAAWLFAIARNHLVEQLRRTRPELVDWDESHGDFLPSKRPSPREEAQLRELHDRAALAIAALPEKLRTAFLLRYHEERSYAEIAEVLQCDLGTVKSRISRARETLAEQLREDGEPSEPGVRR